MDVRTLGSDPRQPGLAPWGVPWPSADDLQVDADTAWAIEVGFPDPDVFGEDLTDIDTSLDDDDRDAARDTVAVTLPDLLDQLERQARERHRASAAEYRLIRVLLRTAVADPEPWVGPDPTLDLTWGDARGRTAAAVRRDRRDLAERAAVAEIATRLRLSEQTVRTRAAHADVLQTRCPDVWEAFAEGLISERHAVESARLAASLPDVFDPSEATPSPN